MSATMVDLFAQMSNVRRANNLRTNNLAKVQAQLRATLEKLNKNNVK